MVENNIMEYDVVQYGILQYDIAYNSRILYDMV